MTQFLKTLPFIVALIAAPAFAAQPDPHAGHHPEADAKAVAVAPKPVAPTPKAKPDAKAAMAALWQREGRHAETTQAGAGGNCGPRARTVRNTPPNTQGSPRGRIALARLGTHSRAG